MKTLSHLLVHHATQRPTAVALREKTLGIWQETTWRDLARSCAQAACGLEAVGLGAGDRIAILGGSRPRMLSMVLAAQIVGGVPVIVHTDLAPEKAQRLIRATRARFAVAEDQEQVDRAIDARRAGATLEHIFYDKARGLRGYRETGLSPLGDLVASGAARLSDRSNWLADQLGRRQSDDEAVVLSTLPPGSDGGAAYVQRVLMASARAGMLACGLHEKEQVLACEAPASPGEFVAGCAQWLVCGFVLHCPEGADTIGLDLRDVGPTYLYGHARMFETLHGDVARRMASIGGWRYRAMALAHERGARNSKRAFGVGASLVSIAASVSVYAPLRNALGLGRVRVAQVAEGCLDDQAVAFFRGIGIPIGRIGSAALPGQPLQQQQARHPLEVST